jgi:hypothetical protein
MWVLIPKTERDSKVGAPRANKGRWLNYYPTKIQFELHVVILVTSGNHYSKIALTKDVLFDHELDLHTDIAGEEPYHREWEDPSSYVPSSELCCSM